MNADLDRCGALAGKPRLACYASLDKTLMTTVVPWVPYVSPNGVRIVGAKVTKWAYDQFSGGTAYAHVTVSRGG